MATNLEVIANALRELNVISEIDTPSAEQGRHALGVLNDMVESWAEDSIELGWFTQDDTTDDCPITPGAKLAVTVMLATMLAPTYGATISAELGVKAARAYATLLRNTVRDQMTEADMTNLPLGEANSRFGVSILTDE